MSKFVVTKAHIDALTQWLIVNETPACRWESANAIGQMLWDENYVSVNSRSADHETLVAPRYEFAGIEAELDPDIMVKQWRCYDYQTRQHPGYEASLAAAFVRYALKHFNGTQHGAGPWGISDLQEAICQCAAVAN
jgi:hypothetical protein